MNEVFAGISNFKIVEKEQLYDWIVVPIFGTSTSQEKLIEAGVVAEPITTNSTTPTTKSASSSNNKSATSLETFFDVEELENDEEEVSELELSYKGSNIFMNILLVAIVLILFGLLIALLIFCRKLINNKCCKVVKD